MQLAQTDLLVHVAQDEWQDSHSSVLFSKYPLEQGHFPEESPRFFPESQLAQFVELEEHVLHRWSHFWHSSVVAEVA